MPESRVTAVEAAVLSAQQLAERVRERMYASDFATKMLDIAIVEVGPGTAHARMTVRRDMLNGFAICHGGLLTTLADTAFAYACNSHDEVTVASGLGVDFVAPAHAGDRLEAHAEERMQRGRTGVYDVTVRNQHGHVIALFRGRSHRIKGRAVCPPRD
ncbi:acyl-coenzyme A thioesterase PaaI [mine drainage metagenome]|uniref:Acyl-coenzyme A thioesterase PaaI n=1 Tax=mine drainage metagenome TaxID=410659 RepID=A0A1J5R1Y2_9ZZZZ